ncbi:MAG: hypothetical protein HOG03_10385 [Desulfobacula sp.]|jgi:putative DNA primase/helicase|uniref:hypothetical protein n=1 Tax=Desulfobacula sp. TaxID=2593537 RepID=UPI001D710E9E|nr:hypothetical protein [Desulfobacula sp.]MBT3804992.1 hypothetical protein [Desulfobacula sp.]MBT4025480.1 hypothetical protein [Desulfobacula sp.]MBT6340936.1 hypothetical protein [Desulfobacula sp.]MBT6750496.1 hypothetical protein [Desulfobacula sp.]
MNTLPEDFFQAPLDFKKFEIFKTEEEETFLTFMGVTYPLRGSEFVKLLNHLHYSLNEFFPSKGIVHEIIDNLDMHATLYAPVKPVYYRFAKLENVVYIDLGNTKFEVVEITGDNYRVITNPPVKFVRSKIQRAIGAPDIKGLAKDLRLLMKYIPFKAEEDFILFASWLLSCMNTEGGYPPLFLIGEQGSAKSTTTEFIKDLLDDSTVPLRNLSKSMKNLMIAASNDFILCYDNISKITDKQSDNICKLATGAGFTTRTLYTTTEETQLTCKRPTIINTISFIPTRQDLLDRSVIVKLNFIKPEERKTVKELKESWKKDRPLIFGALCNAVSAALKNYDQVDEEKLPRMADFAKWIIAAEEQLPWNKGLFLETLQNSRANTVDDTIDAEPVAIAILKLMADSDSWHGTASELLDKLEDCINQKKNKYPNWPKLPNQLSRKLGRVSAFLREKGVQVEKGHSGNRFIDISNLNPEVPENNQNPAGMDVNEKRMQDVRETLPVTPQLPETINSYEKEAKNNESHTLVETELVSDETDF